MIAKIYRPARTAMQSGEARTRQWVLEFTKTERSKIDPLMGWTGSTGTANQIKMHFATCEDAVRYAQSQGLKYSVQKAQKRQARIRKHGYGENFAFERRESWTH